MKTITSREFNQDVSQAKRVAQVEPVIVTDRGRPTHVLMSVDAYRRLSQATDTIVDVLAMPGLTDPTPVRTVDDPWRSRPTSR